MSDADRQQREPDDTQQATARTASAPQIDRRMRMQMLIFFAIYLIMTVLEIERIITQDISMGLVVVGFAIGCILGVFLTRTKVLSFDASDKQIVGSTDTIGITVLVLYLAFCSFAAISWTTGSLTQTK